MSIFSWIKDMFNKFMTAFNDFIKTAFSQATKLAIGQFSAIALQVVAELAATDLSSEEKRKAAFEKIKAIVMSQGKELSDSVINLLIELAVEKWKTMNNNL